MLTKEIEFQSSKESLLHLEDYFLHLIEGISLDQQLLGKVRLCFYEAVTNAVVHGNQYRADKRILISADRSTDQFRLHIHDQGSGFDILNLCSPLTQENLAKESGRGIFFIRQHCDHCKYDPQNHCLQIIWG